MRTDTKVHDGHSPLAILTELAIEGTSSLVEAQRTLLTLAQQENDLIMNSFKERVAGFNPAVALTNLVQRSLDTFVELQQDFLTTASKQALQWLDLEKIGKADRKAYLVDLAREAVENFTRAQKKLLDLVAEETDKLTAGKNEPHHKTVRKTELTQLAREASTAFIEAQRRLLDVAGQQMSVNLDAAMRTMELLSPARLLPTTNRSGDSVKSFLEAEKSLIGSLVRMGQAGIKVKQAGRHMVRRPRATHRKAVLAAS